VKFNKQSSAHWSLPSSSGRSHIDCALLSHSERANSLLCSIAVAGAFWQRGVKRQPLDLTSDFEVVLPQVLLDIDALKHLRERLVEWQVNPSDFNVELGVRSEGDQQLSFSIGQDKDLIYSTDKPAATISYSCGASMNGRWAWVVDQSCIRRCAESIKDFVRAAEAERVGKN
jgi:hypothetical protein